MSVCGKFILGGEHSIVHRGRAIGFPLPGFTLEIEEHEDPPGLIVNGEQRPDEEFRKILELRRLLGARADVRGLSIRSTIPIGAGLGSSAALCAALARRLAGPDADTEGLARAALEGERLFHGRPSGIDPYTIAVGKPIVFRAANLSWKPLDTRLFQENGLRFVLRDSGLRHRTVDVIEAVARVRRETPLIWEDLMDALSSNVEAMVRAFESGQGRSLGTLMNDSHFRLLQLGVSNDRLDALVDDLRAQGALGAKLTGAGQGGCVLALFREEDARSLPDLVGSWPAP
jgi:mevalonate kinase